MRRSTNLLVVVIALMFSVSICFGQGRDSIQADVSSGVVGAGGVEMPAVPYVAEITGTGVYVRSGPGMNYYRCGKLNAPQRVTVVGYKYGWSQIVPPAGSFSWISKQYVKPDDNNPGVGIVTRDNVLVWAGSQYVEPMHSESRQTKLHTGDKVKLLGEPEGGYYKIAPPEDAYLWVSTQYTRYLGKVDEVEPAVSVEPNIVEPGPAVPAEDRTVMPTRISVESQMLEKYYELVGQIEAEKSKPAADQNYADFKQALAGIMETKDAGRAGRYAKFAINQIERLEFANSVGRQAELQDVNLTRIRQQIRAERKVKLDAIVDIGRFAAIGYIRPSQIYDAQSTSRRYLIVDSNDRIICYARPAQSALKLDLDKFMRRKVGLVGTIEADPQSSLSLVRFSEIVGLRSARPKSIEK